ncbi:MAG: histidine kinase [Actinomycetaceae bacterium]|nr:histidine kinase [Actinomycetaceae bacterium]
MSEIMTPSDSFIQASLELAGNLAIPGVLQDFVNRALQLTGASAAAMTVLDIRGDIADLYHHGIARRFVGELGKKIAAAEAKYGLLTSEKNDLYLQEVRKYYPQAAAVLAHPVRLHQQVLGRLYLVSEKEFSDADVRLIEGLAAVAAVAVENSRLYQDSRNREKWIQVSQSLTTMLLEGTDEEDALEQIASSVRKVADADTALLILPSVGEKYACEIADGDKASRLIGLVFPEDGRAMTVLREGTGMVVDSMARAQTMRLPELAGWGPALYAPLLARGSATGVLLLLRWPGKPEFTIGELSLAESVAGQAALALELASARHSEDIATLLDERDRIARDLHDLAIQQLFATGMQIDMAKQNITAGNRDDQATVKVLETALASVDDSVKQIRSIVHNLREPDAGVVLVERLRREASLSRTVLGYAPSLLIELDRHELSGDDIAEAELIHDIDSRVGADIADDIVAVVREGLSNVGRHARAASAMCAVTIQGHSPDGYVRVIVEDDGSGIDTTVARRSGLGNLAARARRHGGAFSIGARPQGKGTLMEWKVPL